MNILSKDNNLNLSVTSNYFNIFDTLDCGQCFRFEKDSDNSLVGVAFGKILKISQTDNEVILHNTSQEDFDNFWEEYFDFKNDYSSYKNIMSSDKTLSLALDYASGIRLLKQDTFETCICFIISQNNNIKRIKSSVSSFCERFGTKILDTDYYSFPSIEKLQNITKEDLSGLSLGYRDDYILDFVRKVSNNELVLSTINDIPIEDARNELLKVKGIGPKVAECILLFGFNRLEAFPIDTWIKKALIYFYPDGFPKEFQAFAGLAQQYIFHYIRTCPTAIPKELKK